MALSIRAFSIRAFSSVVILSVNHAECSKLAHYAECRYTECHYAECRGAIECVQKTASHGCRKEGTERHFGQFQAHLNKIETKGTNKSFTKAGFKKTYHDILAKHS
jgi:hypothetical protein